MSSQHQEAGQSLTLLLTIEEVAEQLRLGRTRTYQLVMSGQIQSVTIGRRRLVPRESLKVYVDGLISSQASSGHLV